MVLLVVGACYHNGLGVDQGVEPDELVHVALHGARLGELYRTPPRGELKRPLPRRELKQAPPRCDPQPPPSPLRDMGRGDDI